MRSWQQLLSYPYPTLAEALAGQQEHMSSAPWQILATNCPCIIVAAETRFLRWASIPKLVHGAELICLPVLFPPPPITGWSHPPCPCHGDAGVTRMLPPGQLALEEARHPAGLPAMCPCGTRPYGLSESPAGPPRPLGRQGALTASSHCSHSSPKHFLLIADEVEFQLKSRWPEAGINSGASDQVTETRKHSRSGSTPGQVILQGALCTRPGSTINSPDMCHTLWKTNLCPGITVQGFIGVCWCCHGRFPSLSPPISPHLSLSSTAHTGSAQQPQKPYQPVQLTSQAVCSWSAAWLLTFDNFQPFSIATLQAESAREAGDQ